MISSTPKLICIIFPIDAINPDDEFINRNFAKKEIYGNSINVDVINEKVAAPINYQFTVPSDDSAVAGPLIKKTKRNN